MNTTAYLEEIVISLALCIAAIAFNRYVSRLEEKDDDDDKE